MTTHKKTVLRAAQMMIDRFGDAALAEVDLRIAELRGRGQHEAEELWTEIRDAVMFLTSKSGKDTKHWDVAASTGSACHSGQIELSPVLRAMGIAPEVGMGAIRFSLGRATTKDEIWQHLS